jgi:hypothetical protein
MRTILAGLAGGILMFLWSSIAHLATPLAQIGVGSLPNEQTTMQALRDNLADNGGLFLFPYMKPGKPTQAEPATGAAGLLVYRPHATMSMVPSNLVIEFLTELAEAVAAAVLLSFAAVAGYVSRLGFVGLVGVVGVITTNVSYWNWYGFPTNYTLAYGAIELIGYLVAGLAIAAIVPKPAATT